MLDWVREIVAFGPRRPGSPAGLEVERHLAAKLSGFGLEDVRLEPVAVNHWAPARAELSLGRGGPRRPCFPVPYTAWTPSGGIQAPCAYLGEGTLADFERAPVAGKVAVFDVRFGDLSASALKAGSLFAHDPGGTIPDGSLHCASWLLANFATYYEAERRGAAALVGILADSPIDGCQHYVPYDGFLKGLPAVWVGRESRAQVTEAARRGEVVRLLSAGRTETVESHNVVATVRGQSDETVVITCHHDAPFASAVEDGSGLAVLLALARRYGRSAGAPRRSLTFVASSGHFHGGVGNREFVKRHRRGFLRRAVAALGIEHVAEEAEADSSGGYRLTGRPEVRALFVDESPRLVELMREAAPRHGLDRTLAVRAYLFGPEPPCDSAPFFTEGIPSVCHITGPLYLFDPHDTVEKVRARDLPAVAGFFSDLVEAIDGIPAAELEEGLTRRRGAPPAPPPPWFLPPAAYPRPG